MEAHLASVCPLRDGLKEALQPAARGPEQCHVIGELEEDEKDVVLDRQPKFRGSRRDPSRVLSDVVADHSR
jgi:hypothetical protein